MNDLTSYRAAIGLFHGRAIKDIILVKSDGNRLEDMIKNARSSETKETIHIEENKKTEKFEVNQNSSNISDETTVTNQNLTKLRLLICCFIVLTIGTVMNRGLIRILLQIGGIEQNPGPETMTDALLLAELILGADDDNIKKILTGIKDPYDRVTNQQTLQTVKVDNLREVARYLGNWNEDEMEDAKKYTKEGLIIIILNKIQAMMPTNCAKCHTKNYSLPSDLDRNSLKCVRCDKAMCRDCQDELSQSVRAPGVLNLLVFHICSSCKDCITSKEQDKHIKKNHKDKLKKAKGREDDWEKDETGKDESLIEIVEKESTQRVQETPPPPIKTKKNCIFFTRYNNCKHGLSGKDCQFTHPKPCPKWRKAGDSAGGCQKGRECQLHHRKICRFFQRGGKCSKPRSECKFLHPQGLKVGNPNPNPNEKRPKRFDGRSERFQSQENTRRNFLGRSQTPVWNQDPTLGNQNQFTLNQEILQALDTINQNMKMMNQNQNLRQTNQPMWRGGDFPPL